MKRNKFAKTVSVFLVTSILAANAFFIFPEKPEAHAQGMVADLAEACLGGLVKSLVGEEIAGALDSAVDWVKEGLGIGGLNSQVPVEEKDLQGKVAMDTIETCLIAVKEIAIRIAREILKKQLLDQIVDQTINWIQNGEEPRFTTNFGDMFSEAVDAGLGETIRQVGLGEFCDGALRTRIQINLSKPAPFYKKSSCTLTQVVGNIAAFKEDFKNGSWIGIQETVNPQNNRHGNYLLAMEKILEETEKTEKESQAKIAGGGGFQPQEICVQWALMKPSGIYWLEIEGNPGSVIVHRPTESDKEYLNPSTPPNHLHSEKLAQGGYWRCERLEVVTPTQTIADATSKVVNSDVDYILNAEDLETYASAIFDAAINRLTKEAVTGLRDFTTKAMDEGRDHNSAINNAASGYGNALSGQSLASGIEAGVRGRLSQQANGLGGALEQASSTLAAIASANDGLIVALKNSSVPRGLTQCIPTNPYFTVTPSTFLPNQVLSEAEERKNTWLPQEFTSLVDAKNAITQLISDLGGNSLTTQVLSGILSQIQETLSDKITGYETILAQVNADKSTAEENRDLCNGGTTPNP